MKKKQPCFAHTFNLIVSHALEDDESAATAIHDVKKVTLFFKQSVQATRELRTLHEKNRTTFKKIKKTSKQGGIAPTPCLKAMFLSTKRSSLYSA